MDERIKTLARQGATHLEQRQLPKALALYAELFQLCEEQRGLHPDDSEVQRFWCLCCNGTGLGYSMSGDQVTARVWFQKGLPLCERLAEASEAVQAGRDLSISYGNMGDTFVAEKNFAEAHCWYKKKWQIARRLAEQAGEDADWYDLAISCCKMGLVSQGKEQLDWYRQAWEILVPLVARNPDDRWYAQVKDSCEKTIRMLENKG